MTPRETMMAIDAYIWRDERSQRMQTKMAWEVAAFSRQKRLPSLKSILRRQAAARPLEGAELQKRRDEFASMQKNLDLSKLKGIKK